MLYEEAGIARKAEAMRVAYGYDRGKAEGREEGMQMETKRFALSLLEQGVDEQAILKASGLSAQELANLGKESTSS